VSYLVLARKYRPQTFEDLVGQEHVSRTIKNALSMGRVAHAFLFTGVRGVGKTTTARIFARALNCLSAPGPTPDPCGRCPACEEILAGRDLDVLEIDAASNTGVDHVRTLQESLPYMPARDRFKVYIVDEVHMLSPGAFNAFLKTLEEPPAHVKFVFATTDAQKVPETVRSRCQRYDFRLIPQAVIEARLREILIKEGLEADDLAVSLVAREAAGSMRDALSLLDQVVALSAGPIAGRLVVEVLGLTDRALLFDLSRTVLGGDAKGAISVLDQAVGKGADLPRLARDFLEHLRNLVVARLGGGPELLPVPETERRESEAQATTLPPEDLDRLFLLFARTAEEISRSPHARVLFEMALVRMAKREPLVPVDELVSRLEGIEKRAQGGTPLQRPSAAPERKYPSADTAPAPLPASPTTPPGPSSPTQPQALPTQPQALPTQPQALKPPQAPAPGPQAAPLGRIVLTGERMGDWRRVLAEIETRRPPLASLLEKLVPLSVTSSEVRLGYPEGSFEGAQASDPQRLRSLREMVREILDPQARVEIVPLPGGAAGTSVASEDAAARAAAQEAARKRIEAHPSVRLTAEVLGPAAKPAKMELD